MGAPVDLPESLVARHPELREARFRRGGIALNVGGWALGATHVTGITLGRTIFLHRDAPLDEGLLLHELRHVHQFRAEKSFPVRYIWQSIRYGYEKNRYEVDARRFASSRLPREPQRRRAQWSSTPQRPL